MVLPVSFHGIGYCGEDRIPHSAKPFIGTLFHRRSFWHLQRTGRNFALWQGLFPEDDIDERHHRNTQNHAEYTEQSAADNHGEQHPHCRQSDRSADNTGINQVAVDLLDNDDKYDKPDGLFGFYQQ